MARSRYSEEYIASIKAGTGQLPADKGQATYVKRLARNYEAGVSRAQLRGHARVTKGEKPLSIVKQEKQKATPGIQKQKVSKPSPLANRNFGQHVQHKRDEKGNITRTRVNARNEETLGKQINKTADNFRPILRLVNNKSGEEVRAIPHKGVTVGDFKREIAVGVAQGKSQKDALRDALSNLFTFYGVDAATGASTSDELEGVPDDISNFVMHAE